MTSTAKPRTKFLLIGWDGADWEHINPLLEEGLLPNLERFINEGTMGNLATLQPILSPMLWNSVATGKYPHKHGIHGFIEPDPHNGGSRPYSSHSRKCKALWNIFSQQGIKTNVVNWWASHPAEKINGCAVSNLIGGIKFDADGPIVAPGTVHPEEKSRRYGRNRVMPEELGSEQICPFIPRGAEINQDEDSRIQMFANNLAEAMTTHNFGTDIMEHEPWDFMAVYYTAIDHFSHGFMPYHPPKLPRVSERDFEIFKDVIQGVYRFSDMMLGRLLQLAGDDCHVLLCSDHGFHSGSSRPNGQPREPAGPAVWHRPYGIFLMKGPGIKKDERIYGASLIDMAPTILATMGLPVGEDMDGRPLLEIFEKPPEVSMIPSWEDVEGEFDPGLPGDEKPLDPEDAEELLKQFIALGYVENPGDDKQKHADNAEIECIYNLARSYLFVSDADSAIPLMEGLVRRSTWESRFIHVLIQAYQRAGYLRQALNLLEASYNVETTGQTVIRVTWVDLQIALGNRDDSLVQVLVGAEKSHNADQATLTRIGQTYVKLSRWKDAERVYRKAVKLHPENAEAWLGLSQVYREMGDFEQTVTSALEAVGLVYRLPYAHSNLGIALAELGEADKAVTALKIALRFSPRFVPANRWLSEVYGNQLGDKEMAAYYAKRADRFEKQQGKKAGVNPDRAEQLFDLPEIPSEAARFRRLIEERPDRHDPRKPSGKTFVLVSGLPRSGTSLMMQMLEAAGLPAKTSTDRPADEDNPKGYYEWEAIKKIATNPHIMLEDGLQGCSIKVVSALLDSMPYAHNYKTIFMNRPIEEVAASQKRMIDRLETDGSAQSTEELIQDLVRHRSFIKKRMELNTRNDVLEIDYPTLVGSPMELIPLIQEFLGDLLPQPEKMIEVIDTSLYRQRS